MTDQPPFSSQQGVDTPARRQSTLRRIAAAAYARWMQFARLIHAVVSRVLLLLVFIVIVAPIGLLAKLIGKRFLARGPDPTADSYWIEHEPAADASAAPDPDRDSYRRQF